MGRYWGSESEMGGAGTSSGSEGEVQRGPKAFVVGEARVILARPKRPGCLRLSSHNKNAALLDTS